MDNFLDNLQKDLSFDEKNIKSEPTTEETENVLDYNQYLLEAQNIKLSTLPESLKEIYLEDLVLKYKDVIKEQQLSQKKQPTTSIKKSLLNNILKENTNKEPQEFDSELIRKIFQEEFKKLLSNYYIIDKDSTEVFLKIGNNVFKGDFKLVKTKPK